MKVKTFSQRYLIDLEKEVNRWLDSHYLCKVKNISYSSTWCGCEVWHCAMVVYEG